MLAHHQQQHMHQKRRRNNKGRNYRHRNDSKDGAKRTSKQDSRRNRGHGKANRKQYDTNSKKIPVADQSKNHSRSPLEKGGFGPDGHGYQRHKLKGNGHWRNRKSAGKSSSAARSEKAVGAVTQQQQQLKKKRRKKKKKKVINEIDWPELV